jgi:hypothetical protein
MHDPKFEKEVQQKMEALEFSPSDAVWIRLEQDLKKEKRRSLPLFWPFFLVGGMLLGAGGTWLFLNHGDHSGTSRSDISRSGISRSGISSIKNASKSTGPIPTPSMPNQSSQTGALPSGLARTRSTATEPFAAGSTTVSPVPVVPESLVSSPGSSRGSLGSSPFAAIPNETIHLRSSISTRPSSIEPGFSGNVASEFPKIGIGSRKTLIRTLTANPNGSSAKKARLSKTPVWEAGFTGGTGISSLTRSVVNQQTVAANPSTPNNYYSAYPFARFAAAPVTGFTPKIQPDLSFWAGVYIQKPILKKWSLSIGLNLHYYSARVSTGQQIVSNSPNAAATLFTSSVVVAAQTFPYYSPGDSHNFLNRYYFLELPVSLQWQFNRSRQIPLFLETGLSAARLMGANSIYYDQAQGIYRKDATPSNSFRLFASAALMAGLHWRGANIQLGPQFQYGLGSVLSSGDGAGQRLLYGGIKITVIPGRR